MKILFIYTNLDTGEAPHFVNGVASLSAVLKQHGHQTALLFLDTFPTRNELHNKIETISPDLIGFSTGSNQWHYVQKLAKIIKSFSSIPIICGGPHPTLAPDEVIAASGIDMLCVGEGEGAILDVVYALEKTSRPMPILGMETHTGYVPETLFTRIPNLWLKQNGKIIRNSPRSLIDDLDSLPFPDREIFDYPYLLKRYPLTATLLMYGRGCPYRCPYCINHALAKLYQGKGKYTRLRSPQRVCDEIEYLHRTWGVNDVLIYDDTFTYDRKWTLEFTTEYKSRFAFPFAVNIRPETVDDELLIALRNAGLYRIIVGVEVGNERIRYEVLNRPISNELLIWLFQRAHELNIRTWANTMMGIPGETPESLQETIDFVRKLTPDHAQVMVFYPYPGTDLGDLCHKQGYISNRKVATTFIGDSVLRLPTVSRTQIKQAVQRFNWESLRGRVEHQTKGEIDLCLWYLDEMDLEHYKPLQAIEINGDERIGIPAQPPSELHVEYSATPGDKLHFAVALDPQVWDLRPEATRFLIDLKQGKQIQRLFERIVDPRHDENDRRWIDESIQLDREGKCELRFRTETVGANPEYGWAYWGHPFLECTLKVENLLT